MIKAGTKISVYLVVLWLSVTADEENKKILQIDKHICESALHHPAFVSVCVADLLVVCKFVRPEHGVYIGNKRKERSA